MFFEVYVAKILINALHGLIHHLYHRLEAIDKFSLEKYFIKTHI